MPHGIVVPMDSLPVPLYRVPPVYPDAAREAGIQGTVLVDALVDEHGRVEATVVVRSVPGLDSMSVATVQRWWFRPAIYQGKAVAAWFSVPVKFSLH